MINTGIYAIYLNEPNKYYIGQGNILERVAQHKSMLKNNKHYNTKLQNAYNNTKYFSYLVLFNEAKSNQLYGLEKFYIDIFDAIQIGYNIISAGISGRGLAHPSSIYTRDQIINAMTLLLDTNNSIEFISKNTGVSESTVRHISRREVHQWLDEEFPEETKQLKILAEKRVRKTKNIIPRKFNAIKSPEGKIFIVDNISAFSRENNLNNAHLGAVLRGSRNIHKGWIGVNIDENTECIDISRIEG